MTKPNATAPDSLASSKLTLRSSPAFRDLGGAPTTDGRQVLAGRLFRADALSALDAADRAVIDSIGLRLVCDLRGADERTRTRCLHWLDPEPSVLHLELSAGLVKATAPLVSRLARGPDLEAAAAMMRTTYAELPRSSSALLGALFESLATGGTPALIHCTAGKDRTGFTVAMLLSALGVSRDFIYEDYLRGSGRDPLDPAQPSSHMLDAMLGRLLEPEEAVLVHGVHREYLDAAFASIECGWGDTLRYLEHVAGVDADRRRALREHLLAW
jgi:protein-tyrosine phosphatase